MQFNLLQEQNPWWKNPDWDKQDPKLIEFSQAKYQYISPLINQFNLEHDNIYLLYGPRQVGKSTLLKLLIKKKLIIKNPLNIFYYLCDLIEDKNSLSELLRVYLDWRGEDKSRKLIILDEISAVSNFSTAIKHLVDLGFFKNTTVILSGSNSVKIKRSGEFMPGRRGPDSRLDFVLSPLNFREYILLQEQKTALAQMVNNITINVFSDWQKYKLTDWQKMQLYLPELQKYFKKYLLTGGFMLALNSLEKNNQILDNVYLTYKHWVISDLAKLDKKDAFFLEIAKYLLKTLTTPVSFIQIAQETNIGSHNTIIDYLETMQDSFLLDLLYYLDLDKIAPAFKKNKKIYFKDPFLFFLFHHWLKGIDYNLHQQSENLLLTQEDLLPKLVESAAVNHFKNFFKNKIFYTTIGKNEIDIIGVNAPTQEQFACEVKYRNIIKNNDLRPLLGFKNRLLISKNYLGIMSNTLILPLEIVLASLKNN